MKNKHQHGNSVNGNHRNYSKQKDDGVAFQPGRFYPINTFTEFVKMMKEGKIVGELSHNELPGNELPEDKAGYLSVEKYEHIIGSIENVIILEVKSKLYRDILEKITEISKHTLFVQNLKSLCNAGTKVVEDGVEYFRINSNHYEMLLKNYRKQTGVLIEKSSIFMGDVLITTMETESEDEESEDPYCSGCPANRFCVHSEMLDKCQWEDGDVEDEDDNEYIVHIPSSSKMMNNSHYGVAKTDYLGDVMNMEMKHLIILLSNQPDYLDNIFTNGFNPKSKKDVQNFAIVMANMYSLLDRIVNEVEKKMPVEYCEGDLEDLINQNIYELENFKI